MNLPDSCPRCAEAGAKSKVFGPIVSPPGDYEEMTDGEGNPHRHYKTSSVATFRCSLGHEWTEPWQRRCAVPGCTWTSPLDGSTP